MPIETRYYDTEGDGYWFKLQPVAKGESIEEAVVSLTVNEADYAAVWLSVDDVEKLIEELKQYLPKKEFHRSIDPNIGVTVPNTIQPQVFYNSSYPDQSGN